MIMMMKLGLSRHPLIQSLTCTHLLFLPRLSSLCSIPRTATIIPGTHSEDVTILERCARTRAEAVEVAAAMAAVGELSSSAVATDSLRQEV